MTELYLILHKVRGEPTFDIAQRMCQGDGHRPCQPNCGLWNGEACSAAEDWIIPTSGHAAYPYATWDLRSLSLMGWGIPNTRSILEGISLQPPTANWPDHYQPSTSPKEDRVNGTSLLASLGLPTKVHSSVSGTLKRRI